MESRVCSRQKSAENDNNVRVTLSKFYVINDMVYVSYLEY